MIIYSIKPQYVELIVNRKKNHEFRNKLPKKIPNIIWIYTTVPKKEIRYFMEVEAPVTYPNMIDEEGIGNTNFNSGWKYARHAYPIIHLYELNDSVKLEDLKTKYNFTAPQSFIYLDNNKELSEYLNSLEFSKIF